MHLLFVGPTSDQPITSMASANGITYISYGNKIIAYKRGREVYIYNSNISLL